MDPLFVAALIAGASYCLAAWGEWGGALVIAWKGAGVALLALWVWRNATGRDGRAMTMVFAFGALGDVLLATSMTAGAGAFLIGHLIAASVYGRHADGRRWPLATLSAFCVALSGWWLTSSPAVALYAATLGLMAGLAVKSTLPRIIPLGAWLFVASDLLIFARLGPLERSMLPILFVWPLYFAGQCLIARGAVTAFGKAIPRA